MQNPFRSGPPVLIAFVVAVVSGCAQISSEQHLAASEAPSKNPCEPAQERSYVATCVSTFSRQPDTPIHDMPSSTQVITRPVIDDQKALTVGDALRNVSGVQGR
jgi:iron complex outermembrane receptor protein